jgi:hypothetical protein
MPVLAIEAVETTSSVKNRKVCVARFWSALVGVFWIACASASGAEPPSDAVGWKRIVIPLEYAFLRCSAHANKSTTLVEDQAAETLLAFADFAVVGANSAGDSVWVSWRFWRQTEDFSTFCMSFVGYLKRFLRFVSDTL